MASFRFPFWNNYPFNTPLSALFFCLLSFFPPTTMTVTDAHSPPEQCATDYGPVVSTTPLVTFLESVQATVLATSGDENFDPKQYIDLSLKCNLSSTTDAFHELPRTPNGGVSASDLEEFLKNYCNSAGEDLVYVEPADFVTEPNGFLPKVENPEVREWALEVHSLWKNLSRKVSDSVLNQPELHTLLPLPEPAIIPGARFREVYYWDSYWVIRGLLASKMYVTATAIVTNLISYIDKYGYVLNGARAYYTNRSQPPLLSAMIFEIYKRTGDLELVRKALPQLLKEYQFWISGIHKVTIQDGNAKNHTLSRYFAMWNKSRPESSTIDKAAASNLSSDAEKTHLYRELASTAETGWDFSTRWMRNASEPATLSTTSIVPVDLNVFLLGMELHISVFAKAVGDDKTAECFLEASNTRKEAIDCVFWNERRGQWLDYWLINGTSCEESLTWQASNQNHNIFASNYIPLWNHLFSSDSSLVEKVKCSLQNSGLIQPAGIATSLTQSGEQWDFPNGWAPVQHMIVEGLVRSGSQEARSLAEDIARRWIRTNYASFKQTGAMHEKYDVRTCGAFGGGGEYKPQTGFGWSNGVVLAFLEEFGWPQDLKIDC